MLEVICSMQIASERMLVPTQIRQLAVILDGEFWKTFQNLLDALKIDATMSEEFSVLRTLIEQYDCTESTA